MKSKNLTQQIGDGVGINVMHFVATRKIQPFLPRRDNISRQYVAFPVATPKNSLIFPRRDSVLKHMHEFEERPDELNEKEFDMLSTAQSTSLTEEEIVAL